MKIYFAGFPGGSMKQRDRRFLRDYRRLKKLYSYFYKDIDWFKYILERGSNSK